MKKAANFLSVMPGPDKMEAGTPGRTAQDVNGHIHTPYSFSAFNNITQIFEMAVKEGVKVVGINDFNVTDGYPEFHEEAVKSRTFPLFNIEFISLLKKEQEEGIRVNDPGNPGRTYFSGKGLDFPTVPDAGTAEILQNIKRESNRQTREMCEKLNEHLKACHAPFTLSFDKIRAQLARDLVRERHLAKALRIEMDHYYKNYGEKTDFLFTIYHGVVPEADPGNVAEVENEIRARLLKKDGPAFVEEDEKAFLELDKVIDVIIKLGGIPCYPVLLDDKKGGFTDYERDFEKLYRNLVSRNIYSLELIPGRNDCKVLKKFVRFFDEKGFVITFGTEHNTPAMMPLKVECRGHVPLDDYLRAVSYSGACVIAAHQFLRAHGEEGYLGPSGVPKMKELRAFRDLGHAVISHFLESKD